MKIVVIGTRGFPDVQGGVETHCKQLYPRLVTRGCEVIVFTRKPYVQGATGVYRGVRLIPLGCPRNKYLEAVLHSLAGVFQARRFAPDALHVHALGPSLIVPLARLLGMKVVITHHGPDYQRKKWGLLAKCALRLGEFFGCTFSHQVICISEPIAAELKRRYARTPVVIPNGVEIPQRLTSQAALQTYGLEPGRYVLAVGRLVPEKGFHDLIEAFVQLQRQGGREVRGWTLVIVGCADHEDAYSQRLTHQAATSPNVTLTGFLTGRPLQELYSHAGLFVLPSYYEGLPHVLLEAMSYGLPCLVSDIPAHSGVGLPPERHFSAGNVQALSEAMQRLIAKPFSEEEQRRQIDRIAKHYSWEDVADRTLHVCQSVLLNGRRRALAKPWSRNP